MDASSARFVDVSSYVQTRSQFRQMSAKGFTTDHISSHGAVENLVSGSMS